MKKLFLPLLIFIASAAIGNGTTLINNGFLINSNLVVDTSDAQIPIVAILGIPDNLTNLSRYQQMKASGITESYYYFPNANSMEAALNVAQKAGIKLFVACPELRTDPEGTANRFMNHPAVAGYFVSDEPSVAQFSSVGSLVKRIRAVDSRHICYVNLLPNVARPSQLGTDSYQNYLDMFVKQVPAQILSFDHYPIVGNGKFSIREQWYSNLESVSNESKRTGMPFWGFALTVAHLAYPVPTLGSLRLQIYSNLAYGAQGIQYFTYWTPTSKRDDFHNGPIGRDGKQTDVYDKITQVDKEIKNLSGVFLGAKVVSVTHTGHVPPGTKSLGTLPRPVRSLRTDNIGAVVSVMKNNGKTYLVVVNHDFTSNMNLSINCAPGVSKILKDGSSVPQSQSGDNVSIEPGDVAIYSWPDSMN
jgi:hypothetical protein